MPDVSSPVAHLPSPGGSPESQGKEASADPPVKRTVFESSNEQFPTVSGGKVAVKIRAHVCATPILDEEVRQAILPALMRVPSPKEQAEIFERELQDLIDREVILQDLDAHLAAIRPQYMDKLKEAAHKEYEKRTQEIMAGLRKKGVNVQTEKDLKKFFASQNQSLEFFQRQTERQFMAMEYMRSRIFPRVERYVTHEYIVEYYQQHPNEFQIQDAIKWQDLFLDAGQYQSREQARVIAEQIAQRARGGEDFANLLQFDNGPAKGVGCGQHRGEIRPVEVEPYLFQMHEGDIGPVVEVTNGFHVFRLVKRDYAGLRPLDEKTQAEIRRKLENAVFEREYKRLVAELKRKAVIEISRD